MFSPVATFRRCPKVSRFNVILRLEETERPVVVAASPRSGRARLGETGRCAVSAQLNDRER